MRIEFIQDPDERLREAVKLELRRYNQTANPIYWEKSGEPRHDAQALHVFAFDSSGEVLGGLFAKTRFSWLHIEIMATRLERRRQGYGRALVGRAEEIALERGCKYAYVDTMDYQAPDFYPRLGYRVIGTLGDWDSHGHAKYIFVKDLLSAPPSAGAATTRRS
jgi:GNAT superfamily N-acetyltransferase